MQVIFFALGLIVGSFLNAVICRLKTGESIIRKRSHCPKCGHILAWYELIPVLSFILQQGKCRECKKTISWQYPAVEIATAALFLIIFNFQFSIFNEFSILQFLKLPYFLTAASLLVIVFAYDLKHYIIPDRVIYPAIALALVYRFFEILSFNHWETLYEPLAVAFISALLFASIFALSKGRWLGFGDVKLVFFMGLFLGWPNILVALFLTFILGGIIGVALIIFGKKTLKSQVPFGPFLVAGTFVALFWGTRIWEWYSTFFI